MLEQKLREVNSSPVASNIDNHAPTCIRKYLQYCNQNEEKTQQDSEEKKKKMGLFRSWSDGQSNCCKNKISCDLFGGEDMFVWKDGRQKSSKRNNKRGSEESILSRQSCDEDEPDVDSGYAWVILIVLFLINASTFGTARAYGLIFENSARRDEQSRSEAALPFTIMGAVENMAGPLTGYLLARTKSWRVVVFAGSCLITVSHLLAAYFESQPGQILTIGLMCGIGQSFISISSFQINNAYFVRYRSRAFGIGLTGAAIGTFYISPLCQFVLDNHSRSLCYLMLGLILLPNVALALLLKPKENAPAGDSEHGEQTNQLPEEVSVGTLSLAVSANALAANAPQLETTKSTVFSISHQLTVAQKQEEGFWYKVGQVLKTPVFHLIWPTQLMFCWLNFVFGMIITDFGKDRGLNETQNSNLIIIWAAGQLCGRLCLGSLVDLRILSYKSFTIVCFASISLITAMLNSFSSIVDNTDQLGELIYLLIFILAMFISTLYILFNGLVVNYIDSSLTALSIGISSFTGSFFLLPRANIIGYYRDTYGNYDSMLTMFTCATMIAALIWLVVPKLCSYLRQNSTLNCNRTNTTVEELLSSCSLSSRMISSLGKPDVPANDTNNQLSSKKPINS